MSGGADAKRQLNASLNRPVYYGCLRISEELARFAQVFEFAAHLAGAQEMETTEQFRVQVIAYA